MCNVTLLVLISTKNDDILIQTMLAQKTTDRNGTLSQPLGSTGARDGGPSAAWDENSSAAITGSSTSTTILPTTSLHQIMLLHDALTQQHPLETANPMASLPFHGVSAISKSWLF